MMDAPDADDLDSEAEFVVVDPAPLTAEQAALATSPFARGTRSVVLAPAGSGKTTVMVHLAQARLRANLACAVVCQYNATGVAFHQACAAQGLEQARVPVYTLNRFAKLISDACHTHCHRGKGSPAPALFDLWTQGQLPLVLKRLSNVLVETGDALQRALARAAPRGGGSAAGPLPAPVVNALSELINLQHPPDYLTWGGLYARWRQATGAKATTLLWAEYAGAVGPALQPLGDGDPAVLEAAARARARTPGPTARHEKVPLWDFVMTWQAYMAVRHGLYDPFYNAHRLELAWFPARFDLGRGKGLLDVLIMDEAQDMPAVDSLYLPRLHGGDAWALEAWYVGDPNQQIHDYRDSINMLTSEAGGSGGSGGSGPDRVFRMTTNFRNPTQVAQAVSKHVRGLPPMRIHRDGGSVRYLSREPDLNTLDGALVMFRTNCGLLLKAAEYFLAMGRPVGVALATFSRVQRAWQRWAGDRFVITAPGVRATVEKALASVHRTNDDLDTVAEARAALDAVLSATSEQGFTEAFGVARGPLLRIMQQEPSVWLCARDEAAAFPAADDTPLFSTVHSCKGQGHQNVVLMPGILCAAPATSKSKASSKAGGKAKPAAVSKASASGTRRCLVAAPRPRASDDTDDCDDGDDGDHAVDSVHGDDSDGAVPVQPSRVVWEGDLDACRLARKCGWPIDAPEGRIIYTAMSRSSDRLRVVVVNRRPVQAS